VVDAREFFNTVVVPNYAEFSRHPTDIRLLWNALISMNTVAEYLALDRLGYPPIPRNVLDQHAQNIRSQFPSLSDLKFCAEAFKHVRKIKDYRGGGFTLQASSTGVLPDDQTTWNINGYDLATVVHNAFATLQSIPELK
jgi:hypothetical protein